MNLVNGKAGPKLKSNPELYLEVRFTTPKGEDGSEWALGWYIFAYEKGGLYCAKGSKNHAGFRAILLRFRRKLDADIARQSLLAHGLVTYKRLKKEPSINVLRIMTENLQW